MGPGHPVILLQRQARCNIESLGLVGCSLLLWRDFSLDSFPVLLWFYLSLPCYVQNQLLLRVYVAVHQNALRNAALLCMSVFSPTGLQACCSNLDCHTMRGTSAKTRRLLGCLMALDLDSQTVHTVRGSQVPGNVCTRVQLSTWWQVSIQMTVMGLIFTNQPSTLTTVVLLYCLRSGQP